MKFRDLFFKLDSLVGRELELAEVISRVTIRIVVTELALHQIATE